MRFARSLSILVAVPALLVGCVLPPEPFHDDFMSEEPPEGYYPEPESLVPTGAIYQDQGHNLALFEDFRARRVGDILTVLLAESTDAAKSSDTTLDKTNSTLIANPVLFGQPRSWGDDNNLAFELSSDSAFDGGSASNQSNKLQGSVTVTIAKVYPGGNFYVKGEKWLELNQGKEYIRLQGIVRPVDISANNTILSTKVADARISYSGTGATADANKVGWLSRFFLTPFWPF